MLADLTPWNIFWDILWFFFLFLWLVILFHIIGDLMRDHETSGVVKAIWAIALIFLPFITVFVYLIARGSGMAERAQAAATRQQEQFSKYVQSTTGGGSASEEIDKAKKLLDAGTITQDDFDKIKARALA
jgi:hypothetical protein